MFIQLRSIEHVRKDQLRSIEHVCKEQLRSIEHVRKEGECHCTPPHKPAARVCGKRRFAWRAGENALYVESLTGSTVTPPPENRPGPNRKGSYSNHPFSGAFAVSFREGKPIHES